MDSVGVGGHKRRADVVTAGSSVGGSVMGEVIRNCQLHVILLYHFEEEKFYMLWLFVSLCIRKVFLAPGLLCC